MERYVLNQIAKESVMDDVRARNANLQRQVAAIRKRKPAKLGAVGRVPILRLPPSESSPSSQAPASPSKSRLVTPRSAGMTPRSILIPGTGG